MGGIGGLLGMGGGASGSGFAAPSGVDPSQLNTAYQQTQAGIKQQQDFVNALQSQNGLGNQSSVFNQLQGVAQGKGPNPAQAQLANATGANVANQAALMAGQRGSGANAGLIARQAAQQGAGIQQNAAGQAAQLQAQQSLNAMNSMGNIANTQVAQHQAGLTGLNQNQLQQQANLMGLQANINSANAGLAGQSQGNQSNLVGNLMGGIGGGVAGLFGGGAGGAADAGGGLMAGGAGDAIGGAGDIMMAAEGGQVESNDVSALSTPGPQSKVGQMFNNYTAPPPKAAPSKGGGGSPLGGLGNIAGLAGKGLMSWGEHEALPVIGDFFSGLAGTVGGADLGTLGSAMAGGAADAIPVVGGAASEGAIEAAPVMLAAQGGKVPALLSPGERYLSPEKAQAAKAGKVDPIKAGKLVPGKPKVKGAKNDYKNDTVKASLEEGGLVLPRSVTESKNPQWAAHKFVQAHMMANGGMIPRKAKK